MNLKRVLASAAAAMVLLTGAASAAAAGTPGTLGSLALATAKYHSVDRATDDGYVRFKDVNGIACIAQPGMGAMGIHYVNAALVADPAIDATRPEAVLYAPGPHGKLTLVAVEYIVTKAAWDATHTAPPRLFGHTFMLTTAPNRFGLPDFYSLHVWIWKNNPAGTFMMWNPAVHCPA